MIKAYKIQ